jgi:hypothetical protein
MLTVTGSFGATIAGLPPPEPLKVASGTVVAASAAPAGIASGLLSREMILINATEARMRARNPLVSIELWYILDC